MGRAHQPSVPGKRPAFYAIGQRGWRGWVTLLHPPYTLWHLAYVAIGAALAPPLIAWRLWASLLAFFLAIGVAAHALDELRGRPLRTGIPSWQLVVAATASLAGAIALGLVVGGVLMLPFIAVGGLLVVGYNLELLGGRLHNDLTFAAGWGAFPVITGYFAQHLTLAPVTALAAAGAFGLSWAQRALSTPARTLRRHVGRVEGRLYLTNGEVRHLETGNLLDPLERALRAMSWAIVALAAALVLAADRVP